jgi:hypothetical protein
MEVRRDPAGWCHMSLSGHAAELISRAGIVELEVSLSHDEGMAAAVVIAVCSGTASSHDDADGSHAEFLLNGAQ